MTSPSFEEINLEEINLDLQKYTRTLKQKAWSVFILNLVLASYTGASFIMLLMVPIKYALAAMILFLACLIANLKGIKIMSKKLKEV